MRYRLPPLSTLRLFEAAGRHGSFKKAAEELGLTPSAVSHGLQTLEDWLGVMLFARTPKGPVLTPAGEAYLDAVEQSLSTLGAATESLPGRAPRGILRLTSAPTVSLTWLLPRLNRYLEANPDLTLAIDTSHRRVDFPLDDFDLALRVGRGDWPGLVAELLFGERLVPVAAPHVARALKPAPQALEGARLIELSSVERDWSAWSELTGFAVPPDGPRLMVDTHAQAYKAARLGLGIALGRLPYVADELAQGHLVPILGSAVDAGTGVWVVRGALPRPDPEVEAFVSWLREESKDLRDNENLFDEKFLSGS
ncbi:MAG: LysR family transcriptional regulator [Rhodospirillum sp.]|nr:LysR family transcriptional regulator [Rhodospirillum sp.]MCF8489401.1 LysR family transcriptional regulator [Rhodospirillum sp.]MCF8500895.1 LysR family transcriptional regulator [Rhodospirillum sp.]